MILYGRWDPFTDAQPVRNHLRVLAARGIGWRRVAEMSGLSRSTVIKVIYGKNGKPPARVRHETAARILAVTVGPESLAPGTAIPAAGTVRRLQALVTCGWTQRELAKRLSMPESSLGSMMRRDRVTAGKAAAVAALYDELWDHAPPSGARADGARLMAAQRGWAPPVAWDDDEIDDPDASPAEGWRRSRRLTVKELADEARDLQAMGAGLEEVAARLGRSTRTVARALAAYPEPGGEEVA